MKYREVRYREGRYREMRYREVRNREVRKGYRLKRAKTVWKFLYFAESENVFVE